MTELLAKLLKANRQHIIDSALALSNHVASLYIEEVAKDLGFKYGKPWKDVAQDIEESLINAGAILPKGK